MGGSLTTRSLDFANKLYKMKLLDSVETRNIEIKLSDQVFNNFNKLIIDIFNFELEWIKYKQKRFSKTKNVIKNDNLSRIKELKKRIYSLSK